MTAGVPQGSILLPLLYIFFVKDLPSPVHEQLISSFYADDTTYMASFNFNKPKHEIADLLQPVLSNLQDYCRKWRMGLNPSKTWALNFNNNKKSKMEPRLKLGGEPISYKTSGKFLGVTFDSKLTFKEHIKEVKIKCLKRINMLKAIRGNSWGTSPETLIFTYKSFVRPIIDYSCVVYAHSGDEEIYSKLRAIETKLIKLAFRLAPWTPYKICYQYFKGEDIISRVKRLAINFINKNRHSDEIMKEIVNEADREDAPDTIIRKILRAQ